MRRCPRTKEARRDAEAVSGTFHSTVFGPLPYAAPINEHKLHSLWGQRNFDPQAFQA